MKKNLKFLFLTPLLFAAICDPADDPCGFEDPETYTLSIDNIKETYASNEKIWLNAETTAFLLDYCTETEAPELIEDAQIFLGGLFILKLNNTENLNAEVFKTVDVTYDVGEMFSFNGCSEEISVLPTLSDDSLFYKFRIGVSIDTAGDYCIVNARDNNFSFSQENNVAVFETYNTLDNKIKFNSCDLVYTRDGTNGHYFFKIQ
ncbi:MAG: hypothetical protein ACON5F_11050 [Jejuia sp.]